MTPENMAATHARAFAGQGRAWSAEEFHALLDSPHVFAVVDTHAFALVRAVAEEAELLTIATDPAHRRQGLAHALLFDLERDASAMGARHVFLEVAADNDAARALYGAAGYRDVARRAGYYARADGPVDAVIMEKAIAGRHRP